VRKAGRIATTGQPLEVPDVAEYPKVVAHPDWAKAEGSRAIGGQPLIHQGHSPGPDGGHQANYAGVTDEEDGYPKTRLMAAS